jgi:hypothetical protein
VDHSVYAVASTLFGTRLGLEQYHDNLHLELLGSEAPELFGNHSDTISNASAYDEDLHALQSLCEHDATCTLSEATVDVLFAFFKNYTTMVLTQISSGGTTVRSIRAISSPSACTRSCWRPGELE